MAARPVRTGPARPGTLSPDEPWDSGTRPEGEVVPGSTATTLLAPPRPGQGQRRRRKVAVARVRRLAARASHASGRATSGLRLDPTFLIMGAQRCGTTSLYAALSQHPGVAPAVLYKEVHYFDTSYLRGRGWYRAHFPLAATARGRITGEASPYYLFHPLAPQRIAGDLPGAKLIVMLRDPVERAHSGWVHETTMGFETEPFDRALDLEPERLDGEVERIVADPAYNSFSHQHHSYLGRGRYAEQLERLFETFPREQVLVMHSSSFFTDPGAEYERVVDFIGLRRWQPPKFERQNARPRSKVPADLRRRLDRYFEGPDERLARLLGETPSWRG
jgi:hypothetical protein